MRYLVIGLGSMGKRRIRNLMALGFVDDVAGFDLRKDRRLEAEGYGVKTYANFEEAVRQHNPDAFLISTPPEDHMHYAYFAANNNISCFIEASVIHSEEIRKLSLMIDSKKIVMAPSCTMRFFPGPEKIKELVNNNSIGKVLNYNYQTGQYLPDWHPWEDIKDFYVSNKDTGGCREIVPFELAWLNDIFGRSEPLACVRRKLTEMPADIEDIYHCLLNHSNNIIGNITIEVISRPRATREMRVLGSSGEIIFSADSGQVRYINTEMNDWKVFNLDKGTVENGYINPEEPYIKEIRAFVDSVKAVKKGLESLYPNTLQDDYNVLQTLYKLESMSEGKDDLSR